MTEFAIPPDHRTYMPVADPAPHHLIGVVSTTQVLGKTVRFLVANPRDDVQGFHYRGFFYEQGVMAAFANYFKPGQVFLDIGSNVGNHAIYAELFLDAGQVIAIECNPDAIAILRTNVLLNALTRTDLSHLGLALSDAPATHGITAPRDNLGMATLNVDPAGAIRSVTGDSLFADRQIDFIKLDVEGMEIAVLRGLEQTIARNRPTLFIEVDHENRAEFDAWVTSHDYQVHGHTKPSAKNQNLVVGPHELK